MNYEELFNKKLFHLKGEGRYRVFAELERKAGKFPIASYHGDKIRDVTVWCSNDYLGQGQNIIVLKAMHEAIDRCGAGAGAVMVT